MAAPDGVYYSEVTQRVLGPCETFCSNGEINMAFVEVFTEDFMVG